MRGVLSVCLFVVATSKRADVKEVVLSNRKYAPASIQDAWNNHFEAFGGQKLDQIMLDYDENSVAQVFNNADGTRNKFTGVAEIRQMFTGLFADLQDLSTLAAPVQDVDEEGRQVFLVWMCPGMGYHTATDTFIFDEHFKISRQNIVVKKTAAAAMVEKHAATKAVSKYAPQSVQEAWDNHFAAFGGQNLDQIMQDYDENSVARVYNNVDQSKSEFKGLAQIRAMFTSLFGDLADLSSLAAPVVDVDEHGLAVFLVWECPDMGYETATDTFVFTPDFKIARQNIVVTKN